MIAQEIASYHSSKKTSIELQGRPWANADISHCLNLVRALPQLHGRFALDLWRNLFAPRQREKNPPETRSLIPQTPN
jgi:hypothetical protein